VHGVANGAHLDSGFKMEDLELGLAVAAVETGTLDHSAALLIHAGFSSRLAAIKAVTVTSADFSTMSELRGWLRSDNVTNRLDDRHWPTPQSHGLWLQFVESLSPARRQTWRKRAYRLDVHWNSAEPDAGSPIRLHNEEDGQTLVLDPDFSLLGRLKTPLNPKRLGLALTSVAEQANTLDVEYLGPNDLLRS
jgi:hypothetical protein